VANLLPKKTPDPVVALNRFAWYSIGFAVFHFVVETLFHVRYGQPLSSLILDYIAVSLLLSGAWLLLAKGWGPGLLCGAWGFETSHTYRSFFWRVEEIRQGTASDLTQNTAYALGVLLAIVAASFAFSIWLCKPAR
jgi:hypothetical protein